MTDSSVLIVVDMQNGFITDRSAHVIPAVVGLVEAWQANGGAVIFTRFHNEPGGPFETIMGWPRLRQSPETDLVSDLDKYTAHARAQVLDKPGYTMFTPEGVAMLKAGGWSDLYVCGIATESCVTKTAVDAFEQGWVPWVLTDACGSHAGTEAHDAGLLVTGRFIGRRQLITSQQALDASR